MWINLHDPKLSVSPEVWNPLPLSSLMLCQTFTAAAFSSCLFWGDLFLFFSLMMFCIPDRLQMTHM